MAMERFLAMSGTSLYVQPGGKNFIESVLSCTISEIKVFLCFMQEFKMAAKIGGKKRFLTKSAM